MPGYEEGWGDALVAMLGEQAGIPLTDKDRDALAGMRASAPNLSLPIVDYERKPGQSVPTQNQLALAIAMQAMRAAFYDDDNKADRARLGPQIRWLLERQVSIGSTETGSGYLTFHIASIGAVRLACHALGWTEEEAVAEAEQRRALAYCALFSFVASDGALRMVCPGIRRGKMTAGGSDGTAVALGRYLGIRTKSGPSWLTAQGRATLMARSIEAQKAHDLAPLGTEHFLLCGDVVRGKRPRRDLVPLLAGARLHLKTTMWVDDRGHYDAECVGIDDTDNPVPVVTVGAGTFEELRAAPVESVDSWVTEPIIVHAPLGSGEWRAAFVGYTRPEHDRTAPPMPLSRTVPMKSRLGSGKLDVIELGPDGVRLNGATAILPAVIQWGEPMPEGKQPEEPAKPAAPSRSERDARAAELLDAAATNLRMKPPRPARAATHARQALDLLE